MTTRETNRDNMQEGSDTMTDAPTADDRDGVTVDGAAMQVQNVDDGARVVVDLITPTDGYDVVGLSIRSDTISGRVCLDPEAAAEVADRLATVAEDADTGE